MSEKNQHIVNYLNWYIHSECENQNFAVLIKGGWGSGKTWFIKKFIEDYDNELKKESQNKSNFLYISLYGLNSTKEIDERIFQQLHPILSSKGAEIAGKIVKSLIKFGIKTDFDDNTSATASGQLPQIPLSDFLSSFKEKTLIFDDFERCNIPTEEVLGYINSFTEHQSKNVIIIANDEEIEDHLTDEKRKLDSKYHQIKEKVIGKSFKIESNISTVINSLIEENSKNSKTALLSRINLLIDVFETIKNKTEKKFTNYRAFSHAIKDFEYIWNHIGSKYMENNELITDFLNIFIRLAYELQLGLITQKDIHIIKGAEYSRVLASLSKTKKEESEKEYVEIKAFLERHNLHSMSMLLQPEVWAQILCETIVDQHAIHESFDNSKHFAEQTTANWVKLWHFMDLEDDEADRLIENIMHELANYAYDDPGVLFHIYGSILRMMQRGFKLPEEIGEKSAKVEELAKNYIDYLDKEDKLPKKDDILKKYLDEAYLGLGYTFIESENFKNIRSYFSEKCWKKLCTLEAKKIEDFLVCLTTSPREFYNLIASPNYNSDSDSPNFWNIPVFQNIDSEKFYRAYRKMPNTSKSLVNDAFRERYEHIAHRGPSEFSCELKFMKGLLEAINYSINVAARRTPTILHLETFKENGLKIAIEALEKLSSEQPIAKE